MSLEKPKNPRNVIIVPVVSEKSYACMDRGQYTFIVAPGSNKTEVKQAVEAISDVKISSVNTINHKGKTHRTRTEIGKSKDTCRAIVTPREGITDISGDVT